MNRPLSLVRAAWLVGAVTFTLVVWSGLSQVFPWGFATVRTFAATSGSAEDLAGAAVERVAPGTFTTEAFDGALGSGISTLTTERSFAWVVSVPRARYRPTRYLALEIACQSAVAALLVAIAALLRDLPRRRVVRLVLLFGIAAAVATYGVMMNWWGLPARYALGMTFNLVAGWTIAGALAAWRLAKEPAA